MLRCADVYSLLRKQGCELFTGVPDSLLKDFCAYVTDHAAGPDHIITANEGNAIALAIGRFLGTRRPALVYMQNSGIGNAVNPLLSLADPDVYAVPMLLMIGWRGAPGTKDEPQHVKQGRRMTELLDAMEIPWRVLPSQLDDATVQIAETARLMRERSGPAALLVRAGTFERYDLEGDSTAAALPMTREDAVRLIADLLSDGDVIVSTTGKASRELYEYRQSSGEAGTDFLTVGGMGHAASIAMGLAQAQRERYIVCLDGDGAVIMHMGALAVIGTSGLDNLLHVVLNNGAHDSVGGQPTAGYGIDIAGVARACGYRVAVCVSQKSDLEAQMTRLRRMQGPALLEVKVRKGSRSDLGRPRSTPLANRTALMQRLGL